MVKLKSRVVLLPTDGHLKNGFILFSGPQVPCERRRISGCRFSPPEEAIRRKYVCVRRLALQETFIYLMSTGIDIDRCTCINQSVTKAPNV